MNTYGERSSYTRNIMSYQKAMKSLIESEKQLTYNNDPESKRQLTKIRLQKRLNQKHWKEFLQSCRS